MSLVKSKDKRTGITYVYESESYWDKEKQQPRAKRKLIGRIDESTGEIVPTDGRGRKRKDQSSKKDAVTTLAARASLDAERSLQEKDMLIEQLRSENLSLKKDMQRLLHDLQNIIGNYAHKSESISERRRKETK